MEVYENVTGETEILPEESRKSEPSSGTCMSSWTLVFIIIMGFMMGQKIQVDPTGREYRSHGPDTHGVSSQAPFAWSGSSQLGVTQNLNTEKLWTLHSYGKNPPISVTQVASMVEVDPTQAAEKLTELVAKLALVLTSVMLGITIGLVIYLVWKGKYWKEMRMLVRATVDLVMIVVHMLQDGTQRVVRSVSPSMDAHEGGAERTSDDDTEVARSAEAPDHGSCESDDTAGLPAIHEESSSDDEDNIVIVSGPAGRYIVRQLGRARVPIEERPVGTVRPQ